MRLFNIFVVAAVVSAGQNRNDDDIDAGESKKNWLISNDSLDRSSSS